MSIEEMKKDLFYKARHAVELTDEAIVKEADAFSEDYKCFLNNAKTEREAVCEVVKKAEKEGFVPFDCDKKYSAGDKVYYINRGKAVILAVIGKKSISEGVKIAVAHIDSPRLDLKPNPLYESDEMALFKTHYYGGIRKYQWVAIPLALHGVIVKANGEKLTVKIGEEEGEPKFVISDLLPHLGSEQNKRTLAEGIQGEELNVIVGSRPFKSDEGSELVKLNILKLLNEKYGIKEADFLSAELEVVPAFKADDIGFDRGLIGSYGHDDRVCAYPAAMAAFNVKEPEYTVLSVLTDKEETGSEGNTGLQSAYMEHFIAELAKAEGVDLHRVLGKSECLSADVNSAYDPTFNSVFEKNNSSYLNKGVVITKYTGARGKSGTSDSSAEYMGKIRRMLDEEGIVWQIGELGKVDAGGGGTVAKFVARLNIDVVDLGVPVLSMHAPYEVISKLDLYMAYKTFKKFFEQAKES